MFFNNTLKLERNPLNNTLYAIFSKVNLLDKSSEYYSLVSDLIENEVVLEMKNYIQHGTTTCYQHCLNVSYYSYKVCKKLGLDKESAARAGLLHDLFLYDWHHHSIKKPFLQKHGFTHPKKALDNANKYFNINNVEEDMILKHMFPLTLKLPKYKETYVIILVDKICCIAEVFNNIFS